MKPIQFRRTLLPLFALLLMTIAWELPTEISAGERVHTERKAWDLGSIDEQRQQVAAVLAARAQIFRKSQDMVALSGPLVRLANTYGWDPLMLLAVIEIESAYNAEAFSYAGAVGLMQLIPYVAKAQAEEVGRYFDGRGTLETPSANMELGVHYLSKLRARYDGNPMLYLTAYNLGPTLLDARLSQDAQKSFTYATKVLSRYRMLKTLQHQALAASNQRLGLMPLG